MKVHDITQPLERTASTWPGDEPFRIGWTRRLDEGGNVNVAAIKLSVHTGTHADGPFHVVGNGMRAGALPVETFIGPARVIDAVGHTSLGEDLVGRVDLGEAERVLFRTRDRLDPWAFPQPYAALTPALARRLVDEGVRVVGTDAPSVDPFESRILEVHRILLEGGVAVLENLALGAVTPGRYSLLALPLRIVEADSAPVRALLVEGVLEVGRPGRAARPARKKAARSARAAKKAVKKMPKKAAKKAAKKRAPRKAPKKAAKKAAKQAPGRAPKKAVKKPAKKAAKKAPRKTVKKVAKKTVRKTAKGAGRKRGGR